MRMAPSLPRLILTVNNAKSPGHIAVLVHGNKDSLDTPATTKYIT